MLSRRVSFRTKGRRRAALQRITPPRLAALQPLTETERDVQAYLDRAEVPPGEHPIYAYEAKTVAGRRKWFVTLEVSAESTHTMPPGRGS